MIRTALIAAALTVVAASAQAQTVHPETQAVSTAGLDLSTPQGAKTFYRDVTLAAVHVCGGELADPSPWARVEFKTCFRNAVAGAVAKAHAPLVTALYRSGKPELQLADR